MKLSAEGRRLIYSFEGKHRALGDGRYVAYRCPAGVATIYVGLTSGVHDGMVVTEAEGEAMFDKEIAVFEAAVQKYVTVDINQNEFDALVSFTYNVGGMALAKSTLLKRLNEGNRDAAAKQFERWNKGGGKVLPGLVARRKRETALFLKPVEAPDDPFMPQRVEPSPVPPSRKVIAIGTGVATSGAAVLAEHGIPPPPQIIDGSVINIGHWIGLSGKLWSSPITLIGITAVAGIFLVPWLIDKWRSA